MPGVVRMLDPYVPLPGRPSGPVPGLHGRTAPRGDPRVRGRRTRSPRSSSETVIGHERDHPAARRLPAERCARCATATGSCLILDEVMAGFGRTGRVVRRASTGTSSRTSSRVAKGINSGLRAARRDDRARRDRRRRCATSSSPAGLTYAGHPLACASAVASIEAFREEGVVENAAAMGDGSGDALGGARGASIRRSATCAGSAASAASSSSENRETQRDARPVQRVGRGRSPVARLAKAALERGLYLMTHWNVIMVVPPLTITREEAEEGVAILDDVLALAGRALRGLSQPAGSRQGRSAGSARRRLVERVPADACAHRGR